MSTFAQPSRALYEWTARIECQKFELGCSYSVIIFLGQVPDNPKEWKTSPNFVGAHNAFVNNAIGDSSYHERDAVTEGFVHLDRAILRHSGLRTLDPDVVVPYLTKNLNWRVLKANSEPAKLNSLEVTVLATPLSYPPGTMFPIPGTAHRYDRITYGREGGSRHAPSPTELHTH